jgi:hypothetical protein
MFPEMGGSSSTKITLSEAKGLDILSGLIESWVSMSK